MPKRKKLPAGEWVSTVEAAGRLSITPQYLRMLRAELKQGLHYIQVGRRNSVRPTYRWNVQAIQARGSG